MVKFSNMASPRLRIPLIAAAIALNVVLAAIVQAVKLPVYIDAVGTILAALLLGLWSGVIVGIASFLFAALLISPIYVYFIGTQICIALYVFLVAKYLVGFSSWPKLVVTGIGLGVVAGVVSAPIIVAVFGGASGTGRDLITALLVSTGQQIISSVLLSGAASEPLDKTLQCALAHTIMLGLPANIRRLLDNPILRRNYKY